MILKNCAITEFWMVFANKTLKGYPLLIKFIRKVSDSEQIKRAVLR